MREFTRANFPSPDLFSILTESICGLCSSGFHSITTHLRERSDAALRGSRPSRASSKLLLSSEEGSISRTIKMPFRSKLSRHFGPTVRSARTLSSTSSHSSLVPLTGPKRGAGRECARSRLPSGYPKTRPFRVQKGYAIGRKALTSARLHPQLSPQQPYLSCECCQHTLLIRPSSEHLLTALQRPRYPPYDREHRRDFPSKRPKC